MFTVLVYSTVGTKHRMQQTSFSLSICPFLAEVFNWRKYLQLTTRTLPRATGPFGGPVSHAKYRTHTRSEL